MIGAPLARLRSERTRQGYTLAALAAKSGVNASTISALEQLRRSAQPKTAGRLAEALGMKVEDLVGGGRGARAVALSSPPKETGQGTTGGRAALLRLADERARRENRLEEEVLLEVLQEYLESRRWGNEALALSRKPSGVPRELRPRLRGTPAADAVLEGGR